jgi:hypothetical protein
LVHRFTFEVDVCAFDHQLRQLGPKPVEEVIPDVQDLQACDIFDVFPGQLMQRVIPQSDFSHAFRQPEKLLVARQILDSIMGQV